MMLVYESIDANHTPRIQMHSNKYLDQGLHI